MKYLIVRYRYLLMIDLLVIIIILCYLFKWNSFFKEIYFLYINL